MSNIDTETVSYENEEELFFQEKLDKRAKTAPPRPLNDIDQFKQSQLFQIIDKALQLSEQFSHPYDSRFDIDSLEGQMSCKNFLQCLEKLQQNLNCELSSREYRKQFSKAYRILYKENELCYLTEILDSAQESVPCLFVNGEKFDFSIKVISYGKNLFKIFQELHKNMRKIFLSTNYEGQFMNLDQIKSDLKYILELFDQDWVKYEELYVQELMIIEKKARKYITDAIQYEQELQMLEQKIKIEDKLISSFQQEINSIKKKLVKQIGKINSVANIERHGRDDLDYSILQSSEEVFSNISECESESLRILAENSITMKIFKKY